MELRAIQNQTVQAGSSVLFQSATSSGNQSILWRIGSGIIILRGLGAQARARFRISYHMNVALSEGAEVAPIETAITINGEAIGTTRTISTPAAVGEFNNVGASTLIDVPAGCCTQISLDNIGVPSIDTENVSLIVERVA